MANQSDVSGRTEQRQEITNQRRHRTGCKQFNEVRTEAISSWRKKKERKNACCGLSGALQTEGDDTLCHNAFIGYPKSKCFFC